MVETPGTIPSIHERFLNEQGLMTRTWYRVIAALTKSSGQLSQPIVVKPNSFFVSGDINSGGTLDPATIPNGTVLGNSSGADAAASPQVVDATLELAGGELGLALLTGPGLLGNAGTVAAKPVRIAIGNGLTLVAGSPPTLAQVSATPGSTDMTAAQVLSWWRSG